MEITRRKAISTDRELVRSIHHDAYRDVVVRQFGGWDGELQDQFFADKWRPAKIELILCDNVTAGFLIVVPAEDHIFISEIVLSPEFQGNGVGTRVMNDEIANAKSKKLPIKLQVLKANKAISLYSRLGFSQYDETETHVLMELK